MTAGLVVAVLVVVVALVLGARAALRPAPSPAVRPAVDPAGTGPAVPADLAAPPGGLVLLQLSAAFCPACRHARALLADVAAGEPRLVHRDVDVAARPELVTLLAGAEAPVTLLVDPYGVELARLRGVPRRSAVTAAMGPHLTGPDDAAPPR